jgi:DNA-binding beta-propeller fold protein YncE
VTVHRIVEKNNRFVTKEMHRKEKQELYHVLYGLFFCLAVPSKARKLLDIPSCATWSKNGTIVAGLRNGTAGNDSMALNNPGSLDIDSDGNLYIVDHGNNRVMQWKNGAMSGIQSGGFIYGPQGIFVSSTGNIYLTDNNEMYKYDSITNSWITIIRKLPSSAIGFYVNEDQSLIYVADYGNDIIMSYNLDGTSIGVVAGVESGFQNDSYHLSDPSDVFVDEYNSYLYVADSCNNRIQRYKIGEKNGVTVAGVEVGCEIDIPVQVIVTSNGDIYAWELFKKRIMKVTNNYTPKCVCLVECSDSQQLDSLNSFQFDRHGNLYVIYHGKHTVLKFDISLDNCGK